MFVEGRRAFSIDHFWSLFGFGTRWESKSDCNPNDPAFCIIINMPAKTVVNTVLLDGQRIVDTWLANPTFTLGEVTVNSLGALCSSTAGISETIESKRLEHQGLINRRDDSVKALREVIVRARAGFKATYGPDSTQYEQAGGTRSSERKPMVRKSKITA